MRDYFFGYHSLVDKILRVAINLAQETPALKENLDLIGETSALVGLEALPLHFDLFPKLWLDLAEVVESKVLLSLSLSAVPLSVYLSLFLQNNETVVGVLHGFYRNAYFREWMETILSRGQNLLGVEKIGAFCHRFLPKVYF